MSKPILAGAMYVPYDHPRLDTDELAEKLTLRYWSLGDQESIPVEAFYETENHLVVPRQYGLSLLRRGEDYVDQRVLGAKLPQSRLKRIQLRPEQEPWVDGIEKLLLQRGDVFAQAATGKGKTVCSLEIKRRLSRATLVIVDQELLRNQWIQQAKKFLGLNDSQIGLIQGERCDYKNKWFVVAMVQTLYSRVFDTDDVYTHFGLVVVDEAHTSAGAAYSAALLQFDAKYRLAVSATPKRKDVLQKILDYNFGSVAISMDSEHAANMVRYVTYHRIPSWYASISPKTGRYINELAGDGLRNRLIGNVVRSLYRKGRDTLVVSDRIEHLVGLMALCGYMGIPERDMGLVAAYSVVYRMVKDSTPKRLPEGLVPDTEYTPVSLQAVRVKISRAVLDERKENAMVIFATYGMFAKGVDVPRLSAGVDATPRSSAQQVHGRILRVIEGKPYPIWVTIRDTNSFRAEYQFLQRIAEYRKSNARIFKWVPGKPMQRKNEDELTASVASRVESLKAYKIIGDKYGTPRLVVER